MLNAHATDVYTDFNGLANLKNEAKSKTPEAIREVAKQFESVFVGMMLKSMRQVKLAEGILDSNQSDFYRDMYDQQLSIHLSGVRGIGLADEIIKQLSPDQSVAVSKNQSIADYERQLMIKHKPESNMGAVEVKSNIRNDNNIDSVIFQSGQDFVNKLLPYAEKAAKELGVDAKVLVAQAALETGWGKSVIKSSDGHSSHNLFNIKADKSWHGEQTTVSTLEFREGVAKKEMAGFRSYNSYQESFDDYVNFIKTNPRYKTAINMAENPQSYMHELQQAGYATDPDYAGKVIKIYQSEAMMTPTSDLLALR